MGVGMKPSLQPAMETFKRAMRGKARPALLGSEVPFGALTCTRSPLFLPPFPSGLATSASLCPIFPWRPQPLSSLRTLPILSALGLGFGSARPPLRQKKGLLLTGKNLLMLNQEDFTFLSGIFNV